MVDKITYPRLAAAFVKLKEHLNMPLLGVGEEMGLKDSVMTKLHNGRKPVKSDSVKRLFDWALNRTQDMMREEYRELVLGLYSGLLLDWMSFVKEEDRGWALCNRFSCLPVTKKDLKVLELLGTLTPDSVILVGAVVEKLRSGDDKFARVLRAMLA